MVQSSGTIKNHSETLVNIGGGARHLTIHPSGKVVYVNEEKGAVVTSYAWDAAAGTLTPMQTLSTLPADTDLHGQVFTAECALHGGCLYVANRIYPAAGEGTVATFGVGAGGGELTLRGFTDVGRHPRHFTVDPSGQWMLCGAMHEHEVRVYRLDSEGVPQPSDHKLAVPTPTHSLFIPPHILAAVALGGGSTTETTVTHADGTKICVKTTTSQPTSSKI